MGSFSDSRQVRVSADILRTACLDSLIAEGFLRPLHCARMMTRSVHVFRYVPLVTRCRELSRDRELDALGLRVNSAGSPQGTFRARTAGPDRSLWRPLGPQIVRPPLRLLGGEPDPDGRGRGLCRFATPSEIAGRHAGCFPRRVGCPACAESGNGDPFAFRRKYLPAQRVFMWRGENPTLLHEHCTLLFIIQRSIITLVNEQ